MNQTGCASGWATDEAFIAPGEAGAPPPCETSLALFFGATLPIAAVRALAAAHRFWGWWTAPPSTLARTPLWLVLVACSAPMWYFLAFLLVGFNVANARNGVSFLLLGLAFVPPAVEFGTLLDRLVRMGARLVPNGALTGGGGGGNGGGAASLSEATSSSVPRPDLSKYDAVTAAATTTQLVTFAVSTVAMVVVCPAAPQLVDAAGSAGFAAQGAFQAACMVGVVYQFQRLVSAIDEAVARKRSLEPGFEPLRIMLVRRSMRERQISIVVVSLAMIIVNFLLAARVLVWSWAWFFVLHAASETAAAVVFEAYQNRSARKRRLRKQLRAAAAAAANANAAAANNSPVAPHLGHHHDP